uniref:Peptidase M14 domain-containing protein n=3 Tax=Auxenochlorella protothecoides TaxID=3075 RepID=A0A1D1ZMW8_AUXPR
MHFAYFAPYPSQRHAELVAELQQVDGVQLSVLGQTLDGRDLDLLQIGTPGEGKRVAWIIARQHPGETMAEWAAEGLLRRLTDRHDPISRALLQSTVFYVVPNMNPDGSARGHLRTNAAGANLNREWAEPSMERSPEVFCVRNAMDRTGVDIMIDIHGAEALPYNFFVSSSAIPGWTPRLADLEAALSAALVVANPDFQTRVGYPRGAPGKGNLSLGSKQVAQRFDCLAVTLEQPFKDTKETPDKEFGWSPQRAQRLGASLLDAILAVVPKLR